MLRCFSVVMLALGCSASWAQAKDGPPTELEGVWRATAIESAGKPAPAEAVEKLEFVIKNDGVVIQERGGRGRESKFKLDATQKPQAIDMIPQDGKKKGETIPGIYELQGDQLKICIPNSGDKQITRPKTFATTADDGLVLFVLKRAAIE